MNAKTRPAISWGGAYLQITYAMIVVAVLPAIIAVLVHLSH